jgi:two-component system response regulator MprA
MTEQKALRLASIAVQAWFCRSGCPMPPRLLIVDDDPELRHFLVAELLADGYICDEAATGQQALGQIRREPFDLVLLDWSLPDFSGVEVCRRMRRSAITTPVLMLTARDDVRERVEALDSGADDYLTKPFSIEELLARIRARLRRTGLDEPDDGWLRLADLAVHPASREVRRGEKQVQLTAREFDLLHHLIRHPNEVQERRLILDTLWGANWVGDDNLLDVYVRYLRKKLEPVGRPTLIQTVRGVGFMLKEGPVRT